MLNRIQRTTDYPYNIIVRFFVAVVFLAEGIQKFFLPDEHGAGFFEMLGVPWAEWTAPVTASVEILCACLFMMGLFTRVAAFTALIVMAFVVVYAEIPMIEQQGFWANIKQIEVEWSMILGSLFLLLAGGGRWSLDGYMTTAEEDS